MYIPTHFNLTVQSQHILILPASQSFLYQIKVLFLSFTLLWVSFKATSLQSSDTTMVKIVNNLFEPSDFNFIHDIEKELLKR